MQTVNASENTTMIYCHMDYLHTADGQNTFPAYLLTGFDRNMFYLVTSVVAFVVFIHWSYVFSWEKKQTHCYFSVCVVALSVLLFFVVVVVF